MYKPCHSLKKKLDKKVVTCATFTCSPSLKITSVYNQSNYAPTERAHTCLYASDFLCPPLLRSEALGSKEGRVQIVFPVMSKVSLGFLLPQATSFWPFVYLDFNNLPPLSSLALLFDPDPLPANTLLACSVLGNSLILFVSLSQEL